MTGAESHLYKFRADRGFTWQTALEKYKKEVRLCWRDFWRGWARSRYVHPSLHIILSLETQNALLVADSPLPPPAKPPLTLPLLQKAEDPNSQTSFATRVYHPGTPYERHEYVLAVERNERGRKIIKGLSRK